MDFDTTLRLQNCLDRLDLGDVQAREEMLQFAQRRLKVLASHMLREFVSLHGVHETDDVLQPALMRLWRALAKETPNSVLHFLRLAGLQIRRELVDLARRHLGRRRNHSNQVLPALQTKIFNGDSKKRQTDDSSESPLKLAQWTEFHEAVDQLAEDQRQAFELLWYHDLTHVEAAKIMNVSDRQLRRYWIAARIRLQNMLPVDLHDDEFQQ